MQVGTKSMRKDRKQQTAITPGEKKTWNQEKVQVRSCKYAQLKILETHFCYQ